MVETISRDMEAHHVRYIDDVHVNEAVLLYIL